MRAFRRRLMGAGKSAGNPVDIPTMEPSFSCGKNGVVRVNWKRM